MSTFRGDEVLTIWSFGAVTVTVWTILYVSGVNVRFSGVMERSVVPEAVAE
jgi:hypothetical protein